MHSDMKAFLDAAVIRAKWAKCNMSSMGGGRYGRLAIPDEVYDAFLEIYFQCCEHTRFCFSEIAGDHSRMFVDIDKPISKVDVTKIETVVNLMVKDPCPTGMWKAIVATRDRSTSIHLIFPGLVVDKASRLYITKKLGGDTRANSLRLVGSYKGRFSFNHADTPYYPLHPDFTIRAMRGDVASGAKNNVPRAKTLEFRVTPTKGLKLIRSHEQWKGLVITKVTYRNGTWMLATSSRYCLIAQRAHSSNHIYFTSNTQTLQLHQRCFHCTGEKLLIGTINIF